jgi:hypothetical protein
MSEPSYQLVAFPIPDYLAQYFSYQLKRPIETDANIKYINIDRHSTLGKDIHSALVPSDLPLDISENNFFLKISNYCGNNYQTPRGDRSFLCLPQKKQKTILEHIQNDFNWSLIHFVKGAEFAHKANGWTPEQKRKGIKSRAIIDFCNNHNVSFDQKNLDSFIKMIQRAQKKPETLIKRKVFKFVQVLSL